MFLPERIPAKGPAERKPLRRPAALYPRSSVPAAFVANHRRGQPFTAGQIMKTITSFVAEPVAIHRFVDPRLKASDAVLVGLDADIAAGAAAGTDRRRLLQIPDANFETEIAIRERAHGADVDDVGRKRVIENRAGKQRDGRSDRRD